MANNNKPNVKFGIKFKLKFVVNFKYETGFCTNI